MGIALLMPVDLVVFGSIFAVAEDGPQVPSRRTGCHRFFNVRNHSMADVTDGHDSSIAEFVPELDRLAIDLMADWRCQALLSPSCKMAR
jgi:hypothetical protein